jgi:phosphatidylserine/phosphatidylglycerophosphate/cardiolipin synthase-like enzyme
LCRRLADPERSKLQLLLVMPDGADSPKEDFVLGDRQRGVRRFVAEVAKVHGHQFRLLMSSDSQPPHTTPATFIHSKLMIVDDEFLTIGSANCTNRSMRVDRELNVAYEAKRMDDSDAELCLDIRALRTSLLAEHAGLDVAERFAEIDGLIGRIDETCADPASKLRCQALPEPTGDSPLLIAIFDPSEPLDWSTFDQTLEQAFDFDEGFIKKSAQKVGQRLGVVDIE